MNGAMIPGFLRKWLNPLFCLTVLTPTGLAAIYYGLIASDVYISESRFVVRMPEKSSSSPLGLFLKNTGFSTSTDESYTAQEAMTSRDALALLNKNQAFAKALARPEVSIFDRFNPLGMSGTFEDLYRRFKHQVAMEHEASGTITVLRVRAFTPDDARKFNEQLLEIAESTVNHLNERGRTDLIRFADKEVNEAKLKAQTASTAVAAFRQRTQIVDPERQATVQLQMIAKLQDEMIATRSQIRAIDDIAPRNPQVTVLRAKLKDLNAEIQRQSADVAGGDRSLAKAAVEFQRLQLDNEVAQKTLAGALASLQEARNEAQRKQAYVERIAQPNLPDAPLEPRRWRGFFSVLLLGFVTYMATSMLLAGLKEHRD